MHGVAVRRIRTHTYGVTTMKNTNRKSMLGLIALSAALAMPMAYAQSQTEEATPQTEQPAPTESATPTDSASARRVSTMGRRRCMPSSSHGAPLRSLERTARSWRQTDGRD